MIEINTPPQSNAKIVSKIIDNIFDMEGELLNDNTLMEFQYKLEWLTNYVTLIAMDIVLDFDENRKKIEDKLVYFFNEDVARLLTLKLAIDNTIEYDVTLHLKYMDYERYCLDSGKCLVYDFDKKLQEWIVNVEMSDSNHLPTIFTKVNELVFTGFE